MPDVRSRFGALSRTPAPDLWSAIEGREPRPMVEPRPRRVLTATLALLVAAAGLGVAALTFSGSERPRIPATPSVAVANGPILYRVGGEGGSTWYSVMPDGSDRRVVFEGGPMRIAQIAWSPDGTKIAYQNPIVDERGIFVANADGSEPVRLTEGANDGWPTWSPDGTRIAFSSTRYDASIGTCTPAGTDFKCPTDIYVMNADGSGVRPITNDPGPEYQPAWSPDGARIAFVKAEDPYSFTKIFAVDPDGSGLRQISSSGGGSDFSPSWSPDASQIVFAAIRREDWGVWVVGVDGSSERRIVDASWVDDSAWSPDGSVIAFVGSPSVGDNGSEFGLFAVRPNGTGLRLLAAAPSNAAVGGDVAWQPVFAPAETIVPEPSPAPVTAEVVGTVEVGEDVRSVVYGEGGVWVAVSNNDGTFAGRILRIDPATHDVQAEIPVEAIPTWEVGGGAMMVVEGSLWVAGSVDAPGAFDAPGGGSDAAVVQVNTSTHEVVETYPLSGTSGADLTILIDELWVLLSGDESVDNRMEVVRVDPETGDVDARIPLSSRWAHTVVAADGHLVTVVGGSGAVNVDGRVLDVDPSTGSVSEVEVPSRYVTPMPVVWRGQVWVSLDPGFIRYDPVRGAFAEPSVTLAPRFADCCGLLEADDRGIWFLSLDPETGTDRQLNLFDPAIGEVRELVTLDEGTPVAMAVAPDSVWILNYEGTLTHVALS